MNRRTALILSGIAVSLCLPWIMPNSYYIQVLVLAVIYIIAAMGINFIYGFTGYISFAQAAFFRHRSLYNGYIDGRLRLAAYTNMDCCDRHIRGFRGYSGNSFPEA